MLIVNRILIAWETGLYSCCDSPYTCVHTNVNTQMRTNEHIQPVYVQFKHPYNPAVRHKPIFVCVCIFGGNIWNVHVSTYPTLSLLQKRKRIIIVRNVHVCSFNNHVHVSTCARSLFETHQFWPTPLRQRKWEAWSYSPQHELLKPWISKLILSSYKG